MSDPRGNRLLMERILSMVNDGKLHPAKPALRPFEEVTQVMTDLLERRIVGKVAIVP
jgi:NADPH2:quinone reductase